MTLVHLFVFSHVVDEFDDWGEVRWAVEVDVSQRILIRLEDAVETVNLRVKDISIEGEAVRCAVS